MKNLTIKQGICLLVCPSYYGTIHLIYFKLGRCIADDPRKCSVKFGANLDMRPALCAVAGLRQQAPINSVSEIRNQTSRETTEK